MKKYLLLQLLTLFTSLTAEQCIRIYQIIYMKNGTPYSKFIATELTSDVDVRIARDVIKRDGGEILHATCLVNICNNIELEEPVYNCNK